MPYKKMKFDYLPPLLKGIDCGFCFYKAGNIGDETLFFDKEGGNPLNERLPSDENHVLTAVIKLLQIQKEGHEVTTDLFIQVAWAVRERRNRDRMGWYSSVACKNTLNAVKKFIEKSYENDGYNNSASHQ